MATRGRFLKTAVLLNASAGAIASTRPDVIRSRVAELFRARGVEADVRFTPRAGLAEAFAETVRSPADVVTVGGGDGTLSAAAAALIDSGKPLGILPLGTANHFARDLGIPTDVEAAISTIVEGHVRAVDVGEMNGRLFLNNSSIGLYPAAVAGRQELRHHGHGRWMATLYAAVSAFRRYPLVTLVLRTGEQSVRVTTPFVFVGNNEYELSLLALGRRQALDCGRLTVYLTRNTGRLGLLRLVLRALFGRLEQDRDFHSMRTSELLIESGRRSLTVAVDGELTLCRPPIRCRVRPRALAVLVPPRAAASGAAA
jgi:diacylglycerol kinase family enzyme